MNSNSNNNENNTMGTLVVPSLSTTSVKHPLANNPITSEQNIDYKDFFNSSAEPYLSPQDGVNIGIDIVGGILNFLGVPGIGIIAEFYKFTIGKLWPSNNSNEIWETFMKQMEELIDKKIAEHIKKEAISKLEGLQNGLIGYINALEAYQRDTKNFQAKSLVKDRFVSLDMIFKTTMPQLAIKDSEALLLPIYAQAANLHLYLIKDAQIFGEEWGMKQKDIQLLYKEQLEATGKYINHCLKWYTIERDRLDKSETSKGWLIYLRFRREMTLVVLDLISLFPYYDTRTYPIPTKVQLTREVYTTPIGYNPEKANGWCRPWTNISNDELSFRKLERDCIRPAHLFEILKSIEITTIHQSIDSSGKGYLKYWSGHSLKYTNVNSSTTSKADYGYLNSSEKDTFNLVDEDIVSIASRAVCLANFYVSYYGVPFANFLKLKRDHSMVYNTIYTKSHSALPGNIQAYNSTDELPLETGPMHNHRLSHITFMSHRTAQLNNVTFPVYSWTHLSADINNTIYPDKITQIPLVKAHTKDSSTGVDGGTGFTGGDLLYRNTPGVVAQLKVTVNSPLSQRYKVRVRYCSTTKMRIFITVSGQRTYATTVDKTRETNETFKFESYNFGTIDTPFTFSKKVDTVTVGVDTFNSSNAKVYIDKVEFIPVK